MSTAITFNSIDTPPLPIHRFTVEQYHRLGELGLLTPDDRVELLEGLIVKKMNQRPAHGYAVRLLNEWFQTNLPAGFLVQCQLPVTTDRSEPEPDVAVIRGAHADYRERHPSGGDCRLLIEVADTSLQKDRARAPIYSSAGVNEYWIVNLVDRQLEVMVEPAGAAFAKTLIFSADDTVETQIGDQSVRLALNQLFGA